MKSNAELKNLAWSRLWTSHWFGRLFGGGLLLGISGATVQAVLSGVFGRLGVYDLFSYLESLVNAPQSGVTVPDLTLEFILQVASFTCLKAFLSFIMAGIASYGYAVILMKCLADDEKNWLGEAFGGFRFPFGAMWLQLRLWLIFFCWGLLGGLPLGFSIGLAASLVRHFAETQPALAIVGVTALLSLGAGVMLGAISVPFYRYRFFWLVKAEHSDWSAGECLRACKTLMDGHKMASFRLDCAYWRPIALTFAMILLMAVGIMAVVFSNSAILKLLTSFLVFATCCGTMVATVILSQYIGVGQGFFYRELTSGLKSSPEEQR